MRLPPDVLPSQGRQCPARVPAGQRVPRRGPGPCPFPCPPHLVWFLAQGQREFISAARQELPAELAAPLLGSHCPGWGPSQDGRWSQPSVPVGGGVQQLSRSPPPTAGGSLRRGPLLNKGGAWPHAMVTFGEIGGPGVSATLPCSWVPPTAWGHHTRTAVALLPLEFPPKLPSPLNIDIRQLL